MYVLVVLGGACPILFGNACTSTGNKQIQVFYVNGVGNLKPH